MKRYLSFSPDEWNNVAVFALRYPENPCAGCPTLSECCGCDKGRAYQSEYNKLTEDERLILTDYRNVHFYQEQLNKAEVALQKALQAIRDKYGPQGHYFNDACYTYFITNYNEVKRRS